MSSISSKEKKMVLLHGKLVVAGQLFRNCNETERCIKNILGDMTVGKTAICQVVGNNDATTFPKTYNCVSSCR